MRYIENPTLSTVIFKDYFLLPNIYCLYKKMERKKLIKKLYYVHIFKYEARPKEIFSSYLII